MKLPFQPCNPNCKKLSLFANMNRWRPVIYRGALYAIIAFLTPLVTAMKAAGSKTVMTWNWVDWVILVLESLLASLLVLRVYVDSSFSKHADKMEAEKTATNIKPTTI